MTDDTGHWAALLQWVLGNPEKSALFLVLLAGAWRWLRELRREVTEDQQHETFAEMLMRENKELRRENKEQRQELLELRRRNGHGKTGTEDAKK